MYKYETHLHTSPVSRCAVATVRENLEFYKELGYDGVFITNHFVDGNINIDRTVPYEEQINFYFSDYEEAKSLSEEIGIKVFCGIESSYKGTDFLIYGLNKEWFLQNPQIMEMKKREQLEFYMKSGALVIQAHPYREAEYIDHIRLFPRSVHGVEVINASRREEENRLALDYAKSYDLLEFAGSDNHVGGAQKNLAGVTFGEPITDEEHFVSMVKEKKATVFSMKR